MASRRKKKRPVPMPEPAGSPGRLLSLSRRHITWAIAGPVILFLFGAYLSVLLFGHQVVPNSDFPAFVRTGREILHFQLPYSFKRLPGLGILQVILSTVVPGPHPVLTAGLLLNAILYPFCGLLLYRIAGRFLGKGAFWITLLALVNPWVLRWLVHPIVELPLIFFILLTFYLLFEKGRWAYPAAFAASMIRYEGIILILIVFLWDFIKSRTLKKRLTAVGLAFLTGLPVALWVLGQILSHGAAGTDDYLSSYQSAAKGGHMVYGKFSDYVWRESIGSYYEIPPTTFSDEEDSDYSSAVPDNLFIKRIVGWISQGALIAGLLAAFGWGIYRKRWDVLSLFLFAGIYFLLHASRTGTRPRYAVPIAWIVLLVCMYGIRSLWEILQGKGRIPKPVIVSVQLILCIASAAAAISLIGKAAELRQYCPRAEWIPLIALIAGILFALFRLVRTRGRETSWILAAVGVTAFALMGNQVDLLQRLGNGAIDEEFKDLAAWYLEHASPGEKIVTTMPHILSLFAPDKKANFVHTRWIEGDDAESFIRDCYKRGITYVAWDSRLGLVTKNAYYKIYRLNRIAALGPRVGPDKKMAMPPKRIGPFEFLDMIQNESYPIRFIFIYKLLPLPEAVKQTQQPKS